MAFERHDVSPEANSLFLPPSLLFSPFLLFPLNINAKAKALRNRSRSRRPGTITDAYQWSSGNWKQLGTPGSQAWYVLETTLQESFKCLLLLPAQPNRMKQPLSSPVTFKSLSDITRPLIISPGNEGWPWPKPCLPSLSLSSSQSRSPLTPHFLDCSDNPPGATTQKPTQPSV